MVHRLLAFSVASLLLVIGCGEGTTVPSAPETTGPSLAASAIVLQFRQITTANGSGAGGRSCGVTTEDVAYCWGANSSGELGDGAQSTDSCGNPCEPGRWRSPAISASST